MGFKIKGGNVKNLREQMAQQADRKANTKNTKFAKWIPRQEDGELEVRFLSNPEDGWSYFEQVFDPSKRGPQILTESNSEYYEQKRHDSGGEMFRPSTRYYAPALEIKTGETIIVEILHSMISELLALGDRWGEKTTGKKGDITGIDIALFKTGTGQDTKYHAAFVGAADLDLSQYEVPDTWAAVEAKVAYQESQDGAPAVDSTSLIEDEVVNSDPPFEPDAPTSGGTATIARKRIIKRK